MLINLLKFETLKKWKSMRYILLAYLLIEIVLMVFCKIFSKNIAPANLFSNSGFVNSNTINGSLLFSSILFFLLACILFIFPFFEGIIRFGKDLSGRQAALELMIPAHSWKKIFAKLIVTVASTLICALIAGVSLLFLSLLLNNFDRTMINSLLNALKEALSAPLSIIVVFVTGFFSYASIYLLFFFCIATANAISNKSKIAVPIGIVVFIASVIVMYYLGELSDKYPIYSFSIYSVSSSIASLLLNILSFAVMFFACTWLMENKIEN